jgi:hypothetical protein
MQLAVKLGKTGGDDNKKFFKAGRNPGPAGTNRANQS